jgi:hypothetical protein
VEQSSWEEVLEVFLSNYFRFPITSTKPAASTPMHRREKKNMSLYKSIFYLLYPRIDDV